MGKAFPSAAPRCHQPIHLGARPLLMIKIQEIPHRSGEWQSIEVRKDDCKIHWIFTFT